MHLREEEREKPPPLGKESEQRRHRITQIRWGTASEPLRSVANSVIFEIRRPTDPNWSPREPPDVQKKLPDA